MAAAAAITIALVSSLLSVMPAQALGDTGTGGVFTPSTGRILDTSKGTGGFATPMEAGKYRTIKVAGLAGLPDDGSVGAVSLNATVGSAPKAGTLFGRPATSSPRTTMLIYSGVSGDYTSNSATVAVDADGTIQVMTETSARLILDVQGYYTANSDGTAAGGFVPVAKRVVDTRAGTGAAKAAISPGGSIVVQVTGKNGIPAGASGAIVNLIAINTTDADGYLTPYATGTTKPANSLHYSPSASDSMQAQVPLSSSGAMTIANSSTTTNLIVDLQGYFTAAGKNGAVYTPAAGRAYDSRATGNTALAKNETRSIQIAGKAGVPVVDSGISAVVLTLIAVHAGSNGYAEAWADGKADPGISAINFQTDDIQTNTITVPLGTNGKIALRNAAAATDYVVDVQGWYSNPNAADISCDSPAADQTTLSDVPANPINCTVSAAPALATDESLAVSIDYGTDALTLPLSETARTAKSITIPNTPGEHSIVVDSNSGSSTLASSNYTFTIGDWRKNTYDSSAELIRQTSLTPALFIGATDTPFPEDAQYRYSVYTTYDGTAGEAPIATSEWTDDAWVVPAGVLQDGEQYFWSADVRGAYDYAGHQDTITTPRFGLAPLATVSDDLTDLPESDADTEFRPGEVCDPSAEMCVQDGYYGWSGATTKVVKKQLVERHHRGPKAGVGCIARGSQPCSTSTSASGTVSIGLGLGMSRKAVAASLNITASATVTLEVRCSAGPHHKVQGYFSGKYYKYKIHSSRTWIQNNHYTTTKDEKTSGWKTTFLPTDIECVESKI